MTKNENQRLCGGTFLTLLLQARKPRMGVRKQYMSESDGLSDPAALIALIKVMVPDYITPTSSMMGTFKGNTSDFKSGSYNTPKKDGLIDQFIYGSISASYLADIVDSL